MIRLAGLTKQYGDKIALDNLDLEIFDGEIFGLIGHNGAGKSTTIKSLVSIIEPTYGQIFVDGKDLKENRLEIKKQIGYVSDSPDMFLKIPAILFWEFIGDIYGVERETRDRKIAELCEIFDMTGNENLLIEEFSHGMRQKAFIIAALLSDPKIWVLDEPMTGLDPQSAFNLKEMMKEHTKKGNTVLFSTHVLEVAERLCDRVGILRKGKLIFVGTIDELKNRYPGESLEKIYLDMVNNPNGNNKIDPEEKQYTYSDRDSDSGIESEKYDEQQSMEK